MIVCQLIRFLRHVSVRFIRVSQSSASSSKQLLPSTGWSSGPECCSWWTTGGYCMEEKPSPERGAYVDVIWLQMSGRVVSGKQYTETKRNRVFLTKDFRSQISAGLALHMSGMYTMTFSQAEKKSTSYYFKIFQKFWNENFRISRKSCTLFPVYLWSLIPLATSCTDVAITMI